MATYTVKKGDTKTKLKQRYGIELNDSQYRSKDPSKLFAGETLNVPDLDTASDAYNGNNLDLSRISEDRTPIDDGTSDEDTNVALSGSASDDQLSEIGQRDPELAAVGRQKSETPSFVDVTATRDNPDGTTTEYYSDGKKSDVTYSEQDDGTLKATPAGPITAADPRESLDAEIERLGREIARKEEARTNAYEDNGIYDDVKRLNELKAEQREAEDRQDYEIGIEKRQELRGKGATKTEFDQATRPEKEEAALDALAYSRSASALNDTIETNMAIVDKRVDAEYKEKEFVLSRKQKRLERLEKRHSDIMSAQQKAALQDRKFQQDMALQTLKSDSDLKKDLLTEIARNGASGSTLERLANGSIDDIYSYQGEQRSPSNWDNLTYQQAAQTLPADEFKRYQAWTERKDTLSEDEKEAASQRNTVMSGANSVINTIDQLLANEEGLENSVGTFWGSTAVGQQLGSNLGVGGVLGLASGFKGNKEAANKFRAQAKNLLSKNTLETLKQLKATGATLGAVNESELNILINAQQALGAIMDNSGDTSEITGRFNLSENDFKEMTQAMRKTSMHIYVASELGATKYEKGNFINMNYDQIRSVYEELKNYDGENYSNELEDPENLSAAGDVIRSEEGFRPDAYQDSTGTWTIGYGTTQLNGRPVQPGDRLSQSQASSLMNEQILDNYTSFADTITRDITPNQFAALTSFEYNLGPGVWDDASGQAILSAINRGDYAAAGDMMRQYNKSRRDGQLAVNPILSRRRDREANLLNT